MCATVLTLFWFMLEGTETGESFYSKVLYLSGPTLKWSHSSWAWAGSSDCAHLTRSQMRSGSSLHGANSSQSRTEADSLVSLPLVSCGFSALFASSTESVSQWTCLRRFGLRNYQKRSSPWLDLEARLMLCAEQGQAANAWHGVWRQDSALNSINLGCCFDYAFEVSCLININPQ